jgi:Flp pilus assembly pilin Flp
MRRKKAQSAVEYAIGVAAIILALVAMQAYVKRGLQGRYKDVVDSATKKVTERQFEPGYEDTSVLAKANINRKKKIWPYDVRRDTFSEKYDYEVKRSETASACSSGGGGSGEDKTTSVKAYIPLDVDLGADQQRVLLDAGIEIIWEHTTNPDGKKIRITGIDLLTQEQKDRLKLILGDLLPDNS